MLLVVVLHMYIPLYILAQCKALESTVAISLKSANWVLQSYQFYTGSGAGAYPDRDTLTPWGNAWWSRDWVSERIEEISERFVQFSSK